MTLTFQTTKALALQGFNQFVGITNAATVKTGFLGLRTRELNWEDQTGANLNLIFAAGCDLRCILTARIENATTQTEEAYFTKKNEQLEEMLDALNLIASNTLNDFADYQYDAFTDATTSFLTNDLELDSSSYDYTQVLSRVAYDVANQSLIKSFKKSGFDQEAKVVRSIVQYYQDLINEINEADSTSRETVATAPATNNLQTIFDSL